MYDVYDERGKMNSREIIRQLKSDGWVFVHSKGSHQQFKHPTKKGRDVLAIAFGTVSRS